MDFRRNYVGETSRKQNDAHMLAQAPQMPNFDYSVDVRVRRAQCALDKTPSPGYLYYFFSCLLSWELVTKAILVNPRCCAKAITCAMLS